MHCARDVRVALPRFDKIADDRLPRAQWPVVDHADLVVLEGWFLKVPPQPPQELAEPINALERDEDAAGTWRRWANEALARDYPPLWSRLGRLLFLQGPGFDIVPAGAGSRSRRCRPNTRTATR
jgi:D-glycerate 3-kinase